MSTVHTKNVSIRSNTAGESRLSPAYDLTSTLPYCDHTLALSLLGSHDVPSRRSLLAFAASVDVPRRAACGVRRVNPAGHSGRLQVDPR